MQKKTKRCFRFFLRPPSKVTNFNPSPMPPPFENFSFNTLNSEEKPLVQNRLTGPVKNRSTGRSTGDDFEIYRSGRVEKILTGSISVPNSAGGHCLTGISGWGQGKFTRPGLSAYTCLPLRKSPPGATTNNVCLKKKTLKKKDYKKSLHLQ